MEARLTAVEKAVVDIRSELRAFRSAIADLTAAVAKIQLDLAEVRGRTSQMPTLIQLITVVIAIWGMAFATLRFAGR